LKPSKASGHNPGIIRRLWSDGSQESQEARVLLEGNQVQYVKIDYTPKNESEKGPILVTARGVFLGKKKIEEYCRYWTRMEEL